MAEHGYTRPRLRVTRACDRCKKRKIRCNGLQPCETCVSYSHPCAYNAPYSRGRHPPSIRVAQHAIEPEPNADDPSPPTPSSDIVSPASEVAQLPSRPPVELVQTDRDGHYLGPTSEAAFLIQVSRTLNPSESFSHVSLPFSVSDGALPPGDPSFDCALTGEQATRFVQVYFENVPPIYHFLHQPTVESWLVDFQDLSETTVGSQQDSLGRKGLLYMVIATALQHMNSDLDTESTNPSQHYFATAEHLLNQRKSPISLTIIQARLCQCLWLLGESRIDQCWEVLGVAARHALAIGLHRVSCLRQVSGHDLALIESSRRTFWCLYSLDVYLSIALGRPQTFNDLDIDQELLSPVDVELGDFEHRTSNATGCANAYSRLSWVIGKVLRDLYSSSPPSIHNRITLATRHAQYLKDWEDEFSYLSNPGSVDPDLQIQMDLLRLSYWYTTILMNRQFLLGKFASSEHEGEYPDTADTADREQQIDLGVEKCVTAALDIMHMLSDIEQTERMIRSFWFTPFLLLSATTVLYCCAICQRSVPGQDRDYLSTATHSQLLLLSLVGEDSLAAKYCLMLEDLRSQILT